MNHVRMPFTYLWCAALYMKEVTEPAISAGQNYR